MVAKIWTAIQNAFSSSSLAALRNVLTALSVFIGALGIAGLTQSKLQTLVDAIMAVGNAGALLITAIGVLGAAAMPIIAALKSTVAAQKKAVASQPHTIVVQASDPDTIVKAANTVAALPGVTQVTSSPRVADATPSEKVVSP
jgi:hypothetical protein